LHTVGDEEEIVVQLTEKGQRGEECGPGPFVAFSKILESILRENPKGKQNGRQTVTISQSDCMELSVVFMQTLEKPKTQRSFFWLANEHCVQQHSCALASNVNSNNKQRSKNRIFLIGNTCAPV